VASAFWQDLNARFRRYRETGGASDWLNRNSTRVRELFSNVRLRDIAFEPIKDVFVSVGNAADDRIRSVITQVAVANAVLAGLPGQLGVGVIVCMGLEGWMAWTIARDVGLKVEKFSDIWKYFGLLAGVSVTILAAFKVLLGFAFSLFSILPGLNPMIPAELFVTDLVGILFWYGFKAARDNGTFRVAASSAHEIWGSAKKLFAYQASILKRGLSPTNLKSMALRVRAWLMGELPVDAAHARGELAATACMLWLLEGKYDGLSGPMGKIFVQAIRDRYPDLAHASIDQIADAMRAYDPGQLEGVTSLIKGRMFELYEINAVNQSHDGVTATSEPDMSHPGDDLILRDDAGREVFVQLKATDSSDYIEAALHKYPDVPIWTTDEVGQHFVGDPRIADTGLSNAKLEKVTHENFDHLVNGLQPISAMHVAAGGVAARAMVRLWPFVVAYLRGDIAQTQLEQALQRVLGDSGVALAARLSYTVLFDALFAWYLLARGVLKIVQAAQIGEKESERVPEGA
jgi:hypothetical protein